nr:Hypothetical protein FSTVLC9_416 [Faustovirus]
MFQSRMNKLINAATDIEKNPANISGLYPDAYNNETSIYYNDKHLDIKFTNVRPVGVKAVTPVRVVVVKHDTGDINAGTWVILGDSAYTWAWDPIEGKMIRKTHYCDN